MFESCHLQRVGWEGKKEFVGGADLCNRVKRLYTKAIVVYEVSLSLANLMLKSGQSREELND